MNKNIMIIWGMLIVLICASLIFISNSKRDIVLLKLERNIKLSAKEYIDNNIEVTFGEPVLISMNDLLKSNYLKEDENIEKYCIKNVLVIRELFYNKYIINKECNDNN